MWSSGRRVLQELLSQPAVRSFSLSPAQHTVVVERWWQVPLSKIGSPPRLHPRRHRIYKLVEDTKHAPQGKMELILTQTVPRLGGRGDVVLVKKSFGRNKLLSQGLAVYPSPENKQMFAEEIRLLIEGKVEGRLQTRTGELTVAYLKRSTLQVMKRPSDEFQLNKEVVIREFQKKLRVVVPPHALSLPFESVTDLGDYWCEVTVNGMDTVRVPISLVPYENRRLKKQMEQQADLEPAAEEEAAVKAASDAAVGAEAVKDSVGEVSEAAAESAVSAAAAAEEAAVKAATDAAQEEAAVKVVSDAAEEEAAVKVVSDAAEEEAAVKAVDAAVEEAAVKAASDAAVEAEAVKDSVGEVSETAASAGVSAAAAEETAASTQTSKDTTAPPSDSPKKD